MERILKKAIDMATKAHEGQTDHAGKPYIGHVSRVMGFGNTIEEKIAGILHDIVEDTPWTFDELLNAGIPKEIVDAIRCLTKIENESYSQFINRVKTNQIAINVKINDLRDNMDITRLPILTDKDIERLRKYHNAYVELSQLKNS